MTELVFMRHGHALSTREAGVRTDSERPLSPAGERDALETARHLGASGFIPDLIISSPFRRADRTAEIAAGVFKSAERRTETALSDGPPEAIMALINALPDGDKRVLLVGHQPLMGAIAGYFAGQGGFDLSPAGFVRVGPDGNSGTATLLEFYSPPLRK